MLILFETLTQRGASMFIHLTRDERTANGNLALLVVDASQTVGKQVAADGAAHETSCCVPCYYLIWHDSVKRH